MIIEVDARSATPPYEQVRAQVTEHVAQGRLTAGSRLPTVRQLAKDLDLAVNTVARAYRELESTGVVVSRGRHGTFVADMDGAATPAHTHAAVAAKRFIDAVRDAGLTRAETMHLVERMWPADQPSGGNR
ncbi:MAG: GntR family transcriptional regulator [Streptosporangiales bacterium]